MNMILKIKPEYIDIFIQCPYTKKVVNTLFLEKELYIAYYNKGYSHIFEEVIEEKPKSKKSK